MRFFKHGEVLAISLPESIRKKFGITLDDDYEFQEWADGSLTLVKKKTEPAQSVSMDKIGRPLSEIKKATPSAASNAPKATSTIPSATAKSAASNTAGPAKSASPSPKNPAIANPYSAALDKNGFLVLLNEDEAKNVSYRYESQIKAGDIKGVRGFDKKFYIATRAYTEVYADKLLVALKEPKTAAQLAGSLKQPEDGILTLLYLLKEEGEIIEKKRGLFVRVL